MIIRELREDETVLLKEFLYEAIYVPAGTLPPERSIIEQPELAIYFENFGNDPADNCLVAKVNGKVVGAVWTRIMNDYGHVDDDTPSMAISLHKEYREKGIGIWKTHINFFKIMNVNISPVIRDFQTLTASFVTVPCTGWRNVPATRHI